jgi:flavin reductase (DIM6/NTAB) family NADH-FMN oxidoreductase RutF
MIDERTFRDALGRFATGVTVVSMDTDEGPRGITVSAFLSLSLRPPLIGVSIDMGAGAHGTLMHAERFGVSILAEEQRPLSDRFAGRPLEVEPSWDRLGGVPVLSGALVGLDCLIVDRHGTGDHTLFVGRIEHAAVHDGTPLLYHRGGYGVG